ncbi:helicase-associated domain-containing protein [Homoserinimonas sp. A520]
MNDILSLATRLRLIDDTALVSALQERTFPAGGIKDFFDLAEALLESTSVQQALSRLDRGTLALLATAGELATAETPSTIAQVATALGWEQADVTRRLERPARFLLAETTDDRAQVYDVVVEQLRSWPVFGLPSREELAADPVGHPPAPVAETERHAIDRLAAERAFSAITVVTALLLELEREPARELAKGGIALPDKKRLANAIATDLDSVAAYLSVADQAGLTTREAGAWLVTERGNDWLLEPTLARWLVLADGWVSGVLPEVRRVLRRYSQAKWGDGLRAHLAWLYPAGGEWMQQRIATFTQSAELLGITGGEAPSSQGALLLDGKPAEAEEALRPLLPTEVEKVYLQHDLSVVAPGPLTPAVDARLRVIADAENRALAATYRMSASSVNRALASGETASTILEYLESISLTGIPQPLSYLIAESAARYGLVRIGELTGGVDPENAEYGARSYLRSDDTNLLGTIVVDQSLSGLGLTRTGTHRVVSRFPLDLVFWTLSDARYPVAAENSQGEIVVLQRRRTAKVAHHATSDPAAELVARLRVGGEPDAGENDHAWLIKQLDAAVRGKLALTVSVTMPNGSTTELQLEPASIVGGRLRARDRNSDIERTLPLSSIAGVSPAH